MNICAKKIRIEFNNSAEDYWEATSESGIVFDEAMRMITRAWEEHNKPKEPLIKDEKIRKAVRAWAEANGLDSLPIYYDANYHRFCDDPDFSITIRFYREVKGELNSGYSYYLDELCGEEEEWTETK